MHCRIVIFLGLLSSVMWVNAAPFHPNTRCTVLYQLDPFLHQEFSQQIAELRSSLVRQRIGFVDLSKWQDQAPHLEINGRQRHQMRQQYHIPSSVNSITVINRNGKMITQLSGNVDVVSAILYCS